MAAAGIAFCAWLLTTRSLSEAWFMPVMVAAGAAVWAAMRATAVQPGPATTGGAA
jgi:hypothetical protein